MEGLDSIIHKINTGLPETKERSIEGLYLKVKTKIIPIQLIINDYYQLPGILLNWINKYQKDAKRDT